VGLNQNKQRFRIPEPAKPELLNAILLFVLAFLFLYLCRGIMLSHNSLVYLEAVGQGPADPHFFYPPHLLYPPSIFALAWTMSATTPEDIAHAGMIYSIAWASITIFSIYMVVRATMGTVAGAIAVCLAALVALGFWVYATQLEVYVPVVGCVTSATALLLTNRSRVLNATRLVAVSALWALATTYHTANVLLFIPFCAFFYGSQGVRGWRQLAMISALAGSLVLAIFGVVYWWVGDVQSSEPSFLLWALEITDRPLNDWGSVSNLWQPRSLLMALWTQIKALTVLPAYKVPLAMFGSILIVTAIMWNASRVLRSAKPEGVRIYFLLLFSVNFIFFTWWIPNVHKFFIPSSIPLLMLIALAVKDIWSRFEGKWIRRFIAGSVGAAIALMFFSICLRYWRFEGRPVLSTPRQRSTID
jgi:hypothetical protein